MLSARIRPLQIGHCQSLSHWLITMLSCCVRMLLRLRIAKSCDAVPANLGRPQMTTTRISCLDKYTPLIDRTGSCWLPSRRLSFPHSNSGNVNSRAETAVWQRRCYRRRQLARLAASLVMGTVDVHESRYSPGMRKKYGPAKPAVMPALPKAVVLMVR